MAEGIAGDGVAVVAPASVYAVLVNWNGWAHTIACLDSLFRLRTPGLRVIVCDNGSGDGSVEHIVAWAQGRLELVPEQGPPGACTWPPVAKPIPMRVLDAAETAATNARDGIEPPLTLIRCASNLGYGGGNNVGIRHALARAHCRAVWLINNDTVVDAGALDALLLRLAGPGVGMCGSTVLHHAAPGRIQCQGGARFYGVAALSRLIGKDRPAHRPLPAARVERRLDHLYGASMLVSRAFIETAGPMPEHYFLFYEEMDWTLRGGDRWRLGYAPDSIVYHRKGAAAGTGTRQQGRAASARRQLALSRLRFARLHRPRALPVVCGLLLIEALLHALRGRRVQALALLQAMQQSRRGADDPAAGRALP
jgi:GT2 family glycosyltransferase